MVESHETNEPLVLYHDSESSTARAASLPAGFDEDVERLGFRNSRFVRTGCGLVFWDYLVLPCGDIVGIVLNDFEVDASLAKSRLLTASQNITCDQYGYSIRLAASDDDLDIDSSQAFGSSLFECNGECLLMLADWHRRGYAFQLDDGVISP